MSSSVAGRQSEREKKGFETFLSILIIALKAGKKKIFGKIEQFLFEIAVKKERERERNEKSITYSSGKERKEMADFITASA